MRISVVQPRYNAGECPDRNIADFLLSKLKSIKNTDLIVLPEYSNAGGLSDKEKQLKCLPRAKKMLKIAAETAKQRGIYVSINVFEERDGALKNATYLFDRGGEVAFVYDKLHLPPAEKKLGITRGSGDCTAEIDGIRFAFLTCFDIYFSEQLEHIANFKPDIILMSGYQRGERTDIIRAQNKLAAFRCNSYIARASFSMDSRKKGGCSMLVAPDGKILKDMGKKVGAFTLEIDEKWKYMRPAGFGEGLVRNDDFINLGQIWRNCNG